jgi:hypothetical protein
VVDRLGRFSAVTITIAIVQARKERLRQDAQLDE